MTRTQNERSVPREVRCRSEELSQWLYRTRKKSVFFEDMAPPKSANGASYRAAPRVRPRCPGKKAESSSIRGCKGGSALSHRWILNPVPGGAPQAGIERAGWRLSKLTFKTGSLPQLLKRMRKKSNCGFRRKGPWLMPCAPSEKQRQ